MEITFLLRHIYVREIQLTKNCTNDSRNICTLQFNIFYELWKIKTSIKTSKIRNNFYVFMEECLIFDFSV